MLGSSPHFLFPLCFCAFVEIVKCRFFQDNIFFLFIVKQENDKDLQYFCITIIF